jgi:hypothetical protein
MRVELVLCAPARGTDTDALPAVDTLARPAESLLIQIGLNNV